VGELGGLGRLLLILGLMLAGLGLFLLLAGRVPFLGRLPGDIAIQRGTWTFYLPLATSILLSLLLTLLLNLFIRR
jgi:hypothetical protein